MCALRQTLAPPPLSPAELRFLRTLADDTEDAPWMVMNDRQWRSASALFWSLDTYARSHGQPWHAGGMLPLTYLPPGEMRRKQVAPDVCAALNPVQRRDSLAVEEGMPPFVLEVVSASSVQRDLEEKAELYRLLGAQEYAIVRLDLDEPRLEGYRQAASGAWEAWAPDSKGHLWSAVLGLVLRGGEVRALTREGEVLPTLAEETLSRQQEAVARERAEVARQQEAVAREQAEAAQRQAEQEVARLRAVLERVTRGGDETSRACYELLLSVKQRNGCERCDVACIEPRRYGHRRRSLGIRLSDSYEWGSGASGVALGPSALLIRRIEDKKVRNRL